ncbi:MAG: tyrosine--tRNA ligase [Candidatus Peregrinibacteria bacterium]|nr:tyrosine--tRNA ligase [Candidatus Peregrinibacteria bacterium]
MDDQDLLTRAVDKVTPLDLAKKKLTGESPLKLYFGIDPTGTKLHLGHSVPLRKLRAFQNAGHHVIFLIGSFTAMIGDPSGRDKQRAPLTREEVLANFETYKEQAALVLDFNNVEVVYNHMWLEKLSFVDVVNLASNFTVQQMLERDMFEKRMTDGNPIGLHEFLYPLMVGYDSVMLDVDCELGGSDQYFNMLAGRTLQSAYGKREKFVLTTKLLEGTDGRKMSKTYDNCIFLQDAPNDMYGKVLSVKDDLIVPYMECATDIPMREVADAARKLKEGSVNPKELKMRLAREIVTLYHSADAAKAAEEEFQKVHKDKGIPSDMQTVTVEKGSALIDVIVKEKMAPSKSEARRLFSQGGVRVNDKEVKEIDAKVEEGIVNVGKRKFIRISLS